MNLSYIFGFTTLQLQSVTKMMGKTATWTMSYFYPLSPLNNVEKQSEKRASSYVMGLPHCIGWDVGFLETLFENSIIFCHQSSEIYRKKERWGFLCGCIVR